MRGRREFHITAKEMAGHDAEEMETGMENRQKETSSDSSDTEMTSKNDNEEADDREWGFYTENSCLLDIENIMNILTEESVTRTSL